MKSVYHLGTFKHNAWHTYKSSSLEQLIYRIKLIIFIKKYISKNADMYEFILKMLKQTKGFIT